MQSCSGVTKHLLNGGRLLITNYHLGLFHRIVPSTISLPCRVPIAMPLCALAFADCIRTKKDAHGRVLIFEVGAAAGGEGEVHATVQREPE